MKIIFKVKRESWGVRNGFGEEGGLHWERFRSVLIPFERKFIREL